MSLLNEMMTTCTLIDAKHIDDGYGGITTTYVDGPTFDAAIRKDSSIEARIAQHDGVTAVYTITTKKNIHLEYHNLVRRETDGKIFRIKSDGDDVSTPDSASINMRQVTAEEWELPTNG